MSARVLFAAGLLTLGACAFEPDLSRFEPCTEAGECPSGFLCLTEAQRCVPECGESCSPPRDGGSDAGSDASVDAGSDAGLDAGEDAGVDAGSDAGSEDAGTEDGGPVLRLAAMTLPAAIETKGYSVDFVPTGGTPGYSFSMDGSVPGFTLSFSGTLATPAAPVPGTFPFSISVEDAASDVVTTPFSLEVRPLLRVANSQLINGRVGQTYVDQLAATGGQPPYSWVVDGGMPPPGLMVLADGGIRGAPSQGGNVMFTVTVSDSAAPPQQDTRVVRIDTPVPLDLGLLAVATQAVRDGRRGTPYLQPLKSYGGNQGGVTWTILPGNSALPPGITLTTATTNGVISGTPALSADAGVYSFSVRCRDGVLGDITQPLSITLY